MKSLKIFFLTTFFLIVLSLAACLRVRTVEPYLRGSLEGVFIAETAGAKTADNESETNTLIRLELSATDITSRSYTFSGTLFWEGATYAVAGVETTYDDRLEYVTPQDRLLYGNVRGQLLANSERVYCLYGWVVNGSASGQASLPEFMADIGVFTSVSPNCEDSWTFSESRGKLKF